AAHSISRLLPQRHWPSSRSGREGSMSLLDWYAEHGRDLPWRRTTDPYAILVSEVMSQQTQVERVVPRWERWLERWPTVEALAAASPAGALGEGPGVGHNPPAANL